MSAPTHDAWSDQQESTTVTVDGHDVSMAYRDEGSGDPVVFLHGIPTWSYLWRQVAPELEDEYRTIVPDLVGYGNSDMRDGFDRSIRAQERAVLDLLDDLGVEETAVVAHDIGGGVALRLAAHHPDRVSKLVCSNAVCYDSWPVEFVNDLGLPRTAEESVDAVHDRLAGAFRQGVHADDPDETFIEGMAAPWSTEAGTVSLSRCAVATNTNHTTEIPYGDIDADLLCLWGGDDVMQPVEYAERLVDDVGGDLVTLDDAYHWVVQDRAEAYVEELRAFL
ncbi:MAG: alpha/beta fold hydrolase [Haloarculaceae archaeon]